MADSYNPQQHSFFSWPPNPIILTFYILARLALLLNNIIGLSLCFAVGSTTGSASLYVAGSFQVISLVILPIFIVSNCKQLRHACRQAQRCDNQLEKQARGKKQGGLKMLRFAIWVDAVAFLAFLIVYCTTMDETGSRWSNRLAHYASVSVLVPVAVHFLLLVVQLHQYAVAKRALKESKYLRCPHCSHTMQPTYPDDYTNSPSTSDGHVEATTPLTTDQLLDTDEETVVGMEPGQETGTCTRTPRVSTNQRRARSTSVANANEDGESEGDRLIEKIASDLNKTTSKKWWPKSP